MSLNKPITALIFDWGDTIMRDYKLPGPMADWPKADWIPGAGLVLQTLSKKYTCIIATSADHSGTEEMIAALQRVGADKYFHHFFSSKELGYKKPDPGFFRSIVEKLNLTPGECVMIGNFYDKDITGAKQIGMQTVLFNENKITGRFIEADVIISKMESLLDVIS
ncbi:MAG: HAD family hydrolase [Bacteroidetes bacterium 4572_114]|nr:MAG: HAD family hydrolase [Bacteroidetes bacterium 4572_114]